MGAGLKYSDIDPESDIYNLIDALSVWSSDWISWAI